MKLKDAVRKFVEALENDKDYYRTYKDNIAMSFKDELQRNKGRSKKSFHEIANKAADNFLKMLIDYPKKDSEYEKPRGLKAYRLWNRV